MVNGNGVGEGDGPILVYMNGVRRTLTVGRVNAVAKMLVQIRSIGSIACVAGMADLQRETRRANFGVGACARDEKSMIENFFRLCCENFVFIAWITLRCDLF